MRYISSGMGEIRPDDKRYYSHTRFPQIGEVGVPTVSETLVTETKKGLTGIGKLMAYGIFGGLIWWSFKMQEKSKKA